MKSFVYFILTHFVLFSFSQSWKNAYDSCLKYQQYQKFKKSIEWGDKALELYDKQVVTKDTNYSNILNTQVENCYYSGLYAKGEYYAKKDSAWTVQNHNMRYSNSCNNLGLLYKEQGKYNQAENLLKIAREITAKLVGVQSLDYASSCNNLASLYEEEGKYPEAEPLYIEAKNIREKMLGKSHPDYMNSCNNLATLYYHTGRYYQAELLLKETRSVRAEVLGKEHIDYANSCNNLAALYRSQGRYHEAELLYKEVKEVYVKVLGKESPDYARLCNNLAFLYEDQGKYLESEPLYKEAKEIYAEILGKTHVEYARTCLNLASIYTYQDKYTEAEELYMEAKDVYLKALGELHPEYANCCNNLALLFYEQGRYSEAEILYSKVKQTYIKTIGKSHPWYATLCINLGHLYSLQNRYTEAEAHYTEAKDIREQILGKMHPEYAACCNNLAKLYLLQNEYNKSNVLFKESLQIKFNEIQNNFRILSQYEKEKYIQANISKYFNSFQFFVLKAHTQIPSITGDSYNLAVKEKGLIFQSMEKIKNRILNSQDEALKRLYIEWKLATDKYAKTQTLTITQRKEKRINLDSLENYINELEKRLAFKSEDFANTFIPKVVTWEDIQKRLKKNQAAIEIVKVTHRQRIKSKDSILYMALIIKKNSQFPEVVVLSNGNELESQYLTNYRRVIAAKLQDNQSYNAFWKPISDRLKNIKTVYLSPDGVYHQINISTLYNPMAKKYVLDEIQVINVTNTRDILNERSYTTKNNYLIGNPKFDLQMNVEKDNEKSKQERTFEELTQLEGAEKEVKQISSLLANTTTVIGSAATEEYIKSIKNPRILHIATHGYFKKEQYQSSTQAMLNAGLLFAGVVDYDRMEIRPLEKEDGKLTAFEVMNMELDSTELVVLSACETGLGLASKEGVYGLQRAFKVAGVQSIIMSLWKVNDEATQMLMTQFYENWQRKGMNKREAFQTAQKQIRKQYKEPYYWGAFVMIE
ncbi:MAG: CHAT domain-containing protein [Bacteroidia bacterium]|nr:CHAT domain-containing protein [Bacteroidia bacterium]MDW8347490.1 CHAT domain-containing tetratricopeptide repeat protein [Bacteroidia bacterium]